MKRIDFNNDDAPGFQIAPMIDIVFVIMLFFMVMAGGARVEKELTTQLPGKGKTESRPSVPPLEINLKVTRNGKILANNEECLAAGENDTGKLKASLSRLKAGAKDARRVVVTITSDPKAKYERTIKALDTLAALGITDVGFNVED